MYGSLPSPPPPILTVLSKDVPSKLGIPWSNVASNATECETHQRHSSQLPYTLHVCMCALLTSLLGSEVHITLFYLFPTAS